jgi:hypothetical protein
MIPPPWLDLAVLAVFGIGGLARLLYLAWRWIRG